MQSSNFTLRICKLLERGYNSTVHGKADKEVNLPLYTWISTCTNFQVVCHENLKPLACNIVKVCSHLVLGTLVLSPLTPYKLKGPASQKTKEPRTTVNHKGSIKFPNPLLLQEAYQIRTQFQLMVLFELSQGVPCFSLCDIL
jgi:hypothetical protein